MIQHFTENIQFYIKSFTVQSHFFALMIAKISINHQNLKKKQPKKFTKDNKIYFETLLRIPTNVLITAFYKNRNNMDSPFKASLVYLSMVSCWYQRFCSDDTYKSRFDRNCKRLHKVSPIHHHQNLPPKNSSTFTKAGKAVGKLSCFGYSTI